MFKLLKIILPILLLIFLAQLTLAQDNVFPMKLPVLITERESADNYSDQQAKSNTEELSNKVNLYFFYGDGCSHCAKEEKFLEQLEKENKNIRVYRYEVWHNRENAQLLSRLARELKLDVSGVPILIIGEKTT